MCWPYCILLMLPLALPNQVSVHLLSLLSVILSYMFPRWPYRCFMSFLSNLFFPSARASLCLSTKLLCAFVAENSVLYDRMDGSMKSGWKCGKAHIEAGSRASHLKVLYLVIWRKMTPLLRKCVSCKQRQIHKEFALTAAHNLADVKVQVQLGAVFICASVWKSDSLMRCVFYKFYRYIFSFIY